MLLPEKKQKVIRKFQTHEGDTGSTQVQVAILSAEIDELIDHLKTHHKDHSSRRGLLKKVGERRRLLRYLKKEDAAGHDILVKQLRLKQPKTLIKGIAMDVPLEESEAHDDVHIDHVPEEKSE